MAFITTEEVKNIRNQLKKEFPKLKFSVTRTNYCQVNITVISGNIDFINKCRNVNFGAENINVNHYCIDRDFIDDAKETLNKINSIAHSQDWYDNSDVMTDYFDTAYYIDIKIGDYDKPYVFKKD